MTLGGLALAVGILVDEATVEVENIHTQMEQHRVDRRWPSGGATSRRPCRGCWRCSASWRCSSRRSSCKGRPRRCSCRCRWPSASRWSRRTSSPARSSRSCPSGCSRHRTATSDATRRSLFDAVPRRLRAGLGGGRPAAVARRAGLPRCVAGLIIFVVGRQLGLEIFPRSTPASSSSGSRPRRHADRADRADRAGGRSSRSSEEVGAENVEISLGYVGVQSRRATRSTPSTSGPAGPEEAVLRVALKPRRGVDVEALKERLRDTLAEADAGRAVLVRAGRHRQRVMSFGSPTPSRSRSAARTSPRTGPTRRRSRQELAKVPSLRDLSSARRSTTRRSSVDIDRERGGLSGVTAEEVARSLVDGHVVEPLRRAELLGRPEDRHRLPGAGRDPYRSG